MVEVRILDAAAASAARHDLADVLTDCVAGGASISFMAPLERDEAALWWDEVALSVERGRVVLLGGYLDGALVGSVQLGLDTPPNQPHRAEVKKLVVHRRGRNRGVAEALMRGLDDEARARGLTLLTLDTATGSPAERLYRRLGWIPVGTIPNYALWPDGGFCDTTIFWKAP